jgi:hypothetical protein
MDLLKRLSEDMSRGVNSLKECRNARKLEKGEVECQDSSMVLYVGLYCDPTICEKVKKGEIKSI